MFNPFSVVTSKVYGGLAVVLALTLIAVTVTKNNEINKLSDMVEQRDETLLVVRANLTTARNNVRAVEDGLLECNAGVAAAAQAANQVALAGKQAVQAVQAAGRKATQARIKQVQAAPQATCADAEALLRSE